MNENEEERELYHLFLYVSKLTFNKTHNQLEKIGLYRGQPPLLFSLWDKDGKSRSELCKILDSKPATITKMIKRLEKSGFVVSRQDGQDSRVSRVFLTTKGKEIRGEVEEIYKNLEKEAFYGFSDKKREILRELLLLMKSNLKND
ncbi:MarR family winged helix-turn-helix transcriptional regulator [Clostridium sp. DL1XJH146]